MFGWSIQSPMSLSAPCDEENRCTVGRSGKYQPAFPASCLKSVLCPPNLHQSRERRLEHLPIPHPLVMSQSKRRPWNSLSKLLNHLIHRAKLSQRLFLTLFTWRHINWRRGAAILHRGVAEESWKKKCDCHCSLFQTFSFYVSAFKQN